MIIDFSILTESKKYTMMSDCVAKCFVDLVERVEIAEHGVKVS